MIPRGCRAAAVLLAVASWPAAGDALADEARTNAGVVEGTAEPDGAVRVFRGIPFAAPPVGDLRWREPQSVAPWPGVRKAVDFGPRCLQGRMAVGPDDGVLVELRAGGRPERGRPPGVAALRQRGRLPRHAPRRDERGSAGRPPEEVRDAGHRPGRAAAESPVTSRHGALAAQAVATAAGEAPAVSRRFSPRTSRATRIHAATTARLRRAKPVGPSASHWVPA